MIREKVKENIFGMIKMNIQENGQEIREMDRVKIINFFKFIGKYFWINGNTFEG